MPPSALPVSHQRQKPQIGRRQVDVRPELGIRSTYEQQARGRTLLPSVIRMGLLD